MTKHIRRIEVGRNEGEIEILEIETEYPDSEIVVDHDPIDGTYVVVERIVDEGRSRETLYPDTDVERIDA